MMSYTYNPFNPGNRNEDFSVLVVLPRSERQWIPSRRRQRRPVNAAQSQRSPESTQPRVNAAKRSLIEGDQVRVTLDAAVTMLDAAATGIECHVLVTRASHYKGQLSVPITSTRRQYLFQMPSNSSPITIPSYRKVLLDQMNNSRVIWTFDPSDFELKAFYWYVLFIVLTVAKD
jgi:hypothetical protein